MRFGTSARRRRFWSLQVRTTGSLGCIEFAGERSVTDIFKTFRGLLGICQRRPCGVEALLLPDDNPHVERELLNRMVSRKNSEPTCWLLKHNKAYNNIRLRIGTPSPHDATTSSSWYQTLTGCQKSTLIYQQHKIQSSIRTAFGQGAALGRPYQCRTLLLDADQSIGQAQLHLA